MVQLTEVTDESVRRPNVGQEDDEGWENESEVVSSVAQSRHAISLWEGSDSEHGHEARE